MSDSDIKLLQLKQYLGEKKLKQLGLIQCSTCLKIIEQATSFSMPNDLDEKPYLTAEEIDQINSNILNPSNDQLDLNATESNKIEKEVSDPSSVSDTPHPLTITLDHNDLKDENILLEKLSTILATASPINTDDLGMGYLYTYPTLPLPHSLSCSECGRLYAIAHPTLELLPLPIYLSDTEYEMIKGIYVDTLL